jgi:hypothetical protein
MSTSLDESEGPSRMTAMLRRKLMLLGKLALLAGALGAAPLVAGCSKERLQDDLKDRTFQLDFPSFKEHTVALTGRPSLGKVWQSIKFAEPLHFTRIDETIEVFGYQALTLADFGEAHTGKYAMRATLRRKDSGGAAGFASKYVVDVEDVRLLRNLVAPAAPPGEKSILPGEVVVRPIVRLVGQDEIRNVDDWYLIDLPPQANARVFISPPPEDFAFVLTVSKDGVPLPLRYAHGSHRFETTSAGTYELCVQPARAYAAPHVTSYSLSVIWGNWSSEGDLAPLLLPDLARDGGK